jgi:hypothetical protein
LTCNGEVGDVLLCCLVGDANRLGAFDDLCNVVWRQAVTEVVHALGDEYVVELFPDGGVFEERVHAGEGAAHVVDYTK